MTPFAPDDRRSRSPDFSGQTLRRNFAVANTLKAFADHRLGHEPRN
jgi:hypothetical protein